MTWQPGDDPEAHPRWADQVALELSMVERGVEKYRERLAKAQGRYTDEHGRQSKVEMTKLTPYRKVMRAMVEDMAKGLHAWLRDTTLAMGKKGTTPPFAYHKLKTMKPHVSAYITLRSVLDHVTVQKLGHLNCARTIGSALEAEAKMVLWMGEDRALFEEVRKGLKHQKATAKHKARVLTNRFNKLVRDDVGWVPWSTDEKLHAGLKLIDIMVQTTGHFRVEEDPTFVRTGAHRARSTIIPSEKLEQYLNDSVEFEMERQLQYLPTLMPPKRWDGPRGGGYYTKIVKTPTLIRFRAENEERQGRALDEYSAVDMPRVYSALAAVQETAWRINKPVLKVMHEAWRRDMGIAGLPKQGHLSIPPRPLEMQEIAAKYRGKERADHEAAWIATHEDEWRNWKRSAAEVYGHNARIKSHTFSTREMLKIADRFRNEEFYFPHLLDFRGRMYPIPAFLNPQGNDISRGLLTFAQGRPLGEHGGWWLAVNVANNAGIDKCSWDERFDWTMERIDLWRRIAHSPLKNTEWCVLDDKPWQLLAAIMEFVRVVDGTEGDHTISSLPVRVDGTCNGIQHLAAMMRDEVAGRLVNLTPAEKPEDIYGTVASDLELTLTAIEEGGGLPGQRAERWLNGVFRRDDNLSPRKFTKKPVMVMPYGGTREGYRQGVMDWLAEHDQARRRFVYADHKERFMDCVWAANQLWEAVKGRVGREMEAMAFIQKCAKMVADVGQPIYWVTPSGFPVRHFYGKLKEFRVETHIDGRTITLVDYRRTRELSEREQLQGISPNFVHSMDGSVNMETAINFTVASKGAPYTTIHDSFGTVAGEMYKLHDTLRYAFVKVHSKDVLEGYRQACVGMLRDHIMATTGLEMTFERAWEQAEDMMPKVPAKGELEIEAVKAAQYFFA